MPDPLPALSTENELAARVKRVLSPTFDLDREIGRGGMGIVYRAMDRRLKRAVAIKVLPPDLAFRSEIRSRFLHEAETAAQLTHPNIVPIYSVDERDGLVYFIMAFVDGDTLAQRLKAAGGSLPVEEAKGVLRQVGSALAYAHTHGVVHRDIKPDNILIAREDGRVMVTDFGIARAVVAGMDSRLTATGVAIGTPAYMSPEQCAGDKEIDGRSDLYSLGVLAYQMLSGTLPFSGNNTASILVKQLSEAPVPVGQRAPGIPPAMAAATMRLLAKSPEQRFPNADAFLRAVDTPDIAADRSFSQAAAPQSPPPSYAPQSPPPGYAPLPPPAPPIAYGVPVPPPLPVDPSTLTRQQRRDLKRGRRGREKILESDPRDVKIRKFRHLFASLGGTMLFLSGMSIVTSPHFFWAIFPDLGLGLTLFTAAGKLWADGISMREVFSAQPPALPSGGTYMPAGIVSPSSSFSPDGFTAAASLVSADVLAGPFGVAVRRAAVDRDRIHDIVIGLDRREKSEVPNAEATARGLAGQVGALASALHRIDVDTPPAQREALRERRDALAAQMDRASILLQTLYLDLVRLRVSNASSGADGVAGVTEQASALSRDIGYLLGAADELRALDDSHRN